MIARWLLTRWRRSDTGLGAAVTGLPTGPLRWAAPPPAPVAPAVPVASVRVVPAEPGGPPPGRPLEPPPEPLPEPLPVLQVVLGFRDGSEAVLDPESAQARALEGIALTLTARDGP